MKCCWGSNLGINFGMVAVLSGACVRTAEFTRLGMGPGCMQSKPGQLRSTLLLLLRIVGSLQVWRVCCLRQF